MQAVSRDLDPHASRGADQAVRRATGDDIAVRRHDTPADPARSASLITLIMLRFAQQPLHPSPSADDDDLDALGSTLFQLFPTNKRLSAADLMDWMEYQEKPLLIAPLHHRGVVGAWRFADITGSARRAAEQEMRGQADVLHTVSAHLELSRDSPVNLATEDDSITVPLAHIEQWAEWYGVMVGWRLARSRDVDNASGRLLLFGPGGRTNAPPKRLSRDLARLE